MDSRQKAEKLVDAIISQAQEQWGDRYVVETVKAYCKIETRETGKELKIAQRRSQIERVFREKSCDLTTLFRLLEVVHIEMELCVRKKL